MNKILFQNEPQAIQKTQMSDFIRFLEAQGLGSFTDYAALHTWSVENIEDFWFHFSNWSGILFHQKSESVLNHKKMPLARFFPDSKINFAENLLRFAKEGDSGKTALISVSESSPREEITYAELWKSVASFAKALKSFGVQKGDRVAGIVSNGPEAVVGMLAATSMGAIWSSCSPDFGFQGILDRFGQIEPKVLLAVSGYRYGGKEFSCMDRVRKIQESVSSIQKTVIVSQVDEDFPLQEGDALYSKLLSDHETENLSFEVMNFNDPIYILYSSGTTGVPKCLVHGGGGVLLQHAKELRLHTDLRAEDRFFYFTTCGWMMWNWLVSGLMTGATLILFDGSPGYPDISRLWKLVEEERINIFGTSAKFLGQCRVQGLKPSQDQDLSSLRSVLSTGSPLLPEDFDWVYSDLKKDLLLSSIAGGTDIVSCFVLGNPNLPVRRGEIQCKGLGMDVCAFDENGKEVVASQGELVCRKPSPSMPVSFWKDPDGEKYRKAYFDTYPDVWHHGDFVQVEESGGVVMYGRSDATLNPSGVRIGTAEIYRQVETMPEVQDSLAVGYDTGGDQKIVLFVLLKEGLSLNEELEKAIRKRIRENTTPRHVPWKILGVADIPYTISGKKVEIAVAKLLRGEEVKNKDALKNPKSLDAFRNLEKIVGA